jgi:hypothetical protein
MQPTPAVQLLVSITRTIPVHQNGGCALKYVAGELWRYRPNTVPIPRLFCEKWEKLRKFKDELWLLPSGLDI